MGQRCLSRSAGRTGLGNDVVGLLKSQRLLSSTSPCCGHHLRFRVAAVDARSVPGSHLRVVDVYSDLATEFGNVGGAVGEGAKIAAGRAEHGMAPDVLCRLKCPVADSGHGPRIGAVREVAVDARESELQCVAPHVAVEALELL
jgi:hypothetical protein